MDKLENQTALSNSEYQRLLEISHTLNSSLDLQRIFDQIIEQLADLISATASSIWLIEPQTHKLHAAAATGKKSDEVKEIHLEIGQGIAGMVVRTGDPFTTRDARDEETHATEIAEKLDVVATTMICVPIQSKDRTLGAIQALNKIDGLQFTEKDLLITEIVASSAGIAIENAQLHAFVQKENAQLRRELGSVKMKFEDVIGTSQKMQEVLELAQRVAQTHSTVLLRGESGTGKELIAQLIHNVSDRRSRPFIPVNCAALPDQLLESELFGHEKGAFTGATARKEGRFELANRGTLFLDEIGDMQITLQAKLLRVLQDGQIYRVGATKPISCDVRIIAATNQALETKINSGEFREDLYYRINVITIQLPPLRERIEDIPRLASHFLEEFSLEMKRFKSGFSARSMQILMNHTWRGNVRELQNAIEHAIVIGLGDEVLPEDLPTQLQPKQQNQLILSDENATLEIAQRQFKKHHITQILLQNDGSRSKTAKILGIQRTYLSRLIRELEIDA